MYIYNYYQHTTTMQLVSACKYNQMEGDVAPLEEDIACTQLEEQEEKGSSMINISSANLSSSTPTHPPHHPHHVVPSGTSTYDIPGNTRKRKYDDKEETEEVRVRNEGKVRLFLQLRRRLLSQRKLMSEGQTGVKLPLFYVYGDLLRLPLLYTVS